MIITGRAQQKADELYNEFHKILDLNPTQSRHYTTMVHVERVVLNVKKAIQTTTASLDLDLLGRQEIQSDLDFWEEVSQANYNKKDK